MDIKITKPSTRVTGIFAVAMMAVVILFSSCTARKAFQTFLDIPVTKPLNVNKASVTNSSICHAAVSESKVVNNVANPSVDAGISSLDHRSPQFPSFSIDNTISVLPGRKVTQQLPPYILYKQMKVFS